jgi:hypothetical protein
MKKIKSFIILLAFFAVPLLTFAQPDPRLNGNGTGVGNTPVGPSGAPIDGGFSIFLLLGAAYGVRKWFVSKKK